MRPSIGVVIATPGRRSIFRTLQSIMYQGLQQGDDILVVGDGDHEPTRVLVKTLGHPFRYEATKVTRTWGHDQLNHGVKKVGGDVLIYQDDDDIFAPRAFDEIRRLAVHFPNVPILGRVKTPHWGILWQKAAPDALLDGHCLVVPNVKEKLGYFTREYTGDQAWIKTCLEKYEEVYWADRVWSLTRPTWLLYPHRALPGLIKNTEPYSENFWREIRDRLGPDLEGREFNGENDWAWYFFQPGLGSLAPVAAIKMYQDDKRMIAAMSFVPGAEPFLGELAEFAAWAAQGLDCWMFVREGDHEVIEVLTQKGYQSHGTRNGITEYIHDWPPKFFEKQEPKPLIVDPRAEG
jgi:glycosyltransferase involved in cell wall biosynthesis